MKSAMFGCLFDKGWTHDGYCHQPDKNCNNQVDKVLGISVTQSYHLIVTISVSGDEKDIEKVVIARQWERVYTAVIKNG